MSIADVTAARLLPALSAILQRQVSLTTEKRGDSTQSFAIRSTTPGLSFVADDGRPFRAAERELLNEILELLRAAQESDARFHELESRMLRLQRENLDLTVRNRTLSEVTSRDALTGLYTRWYVIEKIDSEINRSLRHGSPMAVLMLDIDHFKSVNDSYGHAAGDAVLQCVGKVLRESCRVYDVPGRYGGEEFCIVLPETKVVNTGVVAERIRARLEKTMLPIGQQGALTVTASIGIAGVDAEPGDSVLSPAALLERADRALYTAKNRGRNRVEFWGDELMIQAAPAGHVSLRDH